MGSNKDFLTPQEERELEKELESFKRNMVRGTIVGSCISTALFLGSHGGNVWLVICLILVAFSVLAAYVMEVWNYGSKK